VTRAVIFPPAGGLCRVSCERRERRGGGRTRGVFIVLDCLIDLDRNEEPNPHGNIGYTLFYTVTIS
jgi:hypothetical protein